MSWTFKINTNTEASPVWTDINPVIDGGIEKEVPNNEIYARLKADGKMSLYGSENTTVKALSRPTTEMRVYYSGSLICTVKVDIKNKQDEDTNFGLYQIKETDDGYIDLTGKSSEDFNIFENTLGRTCRIDMNYSDLVFQQGAAWTDGEAGAVFYTAAGIDVYSRRELWIKTNQIDDYSGWTIVSTTFESYGWYKIAREWNHSGTPYGSPAAHVVTIGSILTAPVSTKYRYLTTSHTVLIKDSSGGNTYILDDHAYYTNWTYTANPYIDYSRMRRFDGCILNLVKQIDDSIEFDSDSFKILDDSNQNGDMLISGISDFILSKTYAVSGLSVAIVLTQKSSAQTVAMMSFDTIMNYLRDNYNIYYRLELISGDYYFRLVKYSALSYTAAGSGNDLTTRHGVNVTASGNVYEQKTIERWGKLIRKTLARNIDNIGLDMSIADFINIYPDKTINNDKFYNDIYDSILSTYAEDNKYPITDNQFFIVAAYPISYKYFTTGIFDYADCTPSYALDSLTVVSDLVAYTGLVELTHSITLAGSPRICQGDKVHLSFTFTGNPAKFKLYFVIANEGITEYKKQLTYVVGSNTFDLLVDENIGNNNGSCWFEVEVINSASVTYTGVFTNIGLSYIIWSYHGLYQYSGLANEYGISKAVSQGSIDYTWGNDAKPTTPVIINGVSTACTVKPLKEFEYICTDENPANIDETMYIKTDQGTTGRLSSVKTFFNRKLGRIKVLN